MDFLLSCNETISNGGGIYKCTFDGRTVNSKRVIEIDMPMYVSCFDETIYVLIRKPFENSANSGMAAYRKTSSGYTRIGGIINTSGEVACHMFAENKRAYIANYISGSVFSTDGKTAEHSGKGVNLLRQDAPHTHCVIPSPDGKYVLAADLGLDRIFVYDKFLNLVSRVQAPAGHGPRHIVFSENGKTLYCVNELKSSVSVYTYQNGALALECTVYDENSDTAGNTAAAIRLSADGQRVYISNRGADKISVFENRNGVLNFNKSYDCGGNIPWDFVLSKCEKFLLCANTSGNVSIIPLKNGILSESGRITKRFSRPNCITLI